MLRKLLYYYEGQVEIDFDLFDASYGGLHGAVRMLLAEGVDPDTRDSDGWTALMYATYGGHLEVVEVLLDAGADASIESYGASALWWAREKGHSGIVHLLESHTAAT